MRRTTQNKAVIYSFLTQKAKIHRLRGPSKKIIGAGTLPSFPGP